MHRKVSINVRFDSLLSIKDRTFIKWLFIASSTFCIDFIFFLLLNPLLGIWIANLVSLVTATVYNFFGHRNWTFRNSNLIRLTFARYFLIIALTYLFSTTLVKDLICWNVNPAFAKITSQIIFVPINYVLLRRIVFQ